MSITQLDPLRRGDKGPAVIELQMRLAGFRGTVPDGDYGPGTELQVQAFQRQIMQQSEPSGVADEDVMRAIVEFGTAWPFDFGKLKCPCGQCGGFGQNRFKGIYRNNTRLEVYNRYEYPGIHRMLLWSVRAAYYQAGLKGWRLTINSAYRCSIDGANHNRSSTNHQGKAIDLDIIGTDGTDRQRCDTLRYLLEEKANFQNGWNVPNRKSYEPATIAPTWVHIDVRSYAETYLQDRYFVKTTTAFDALPPPA
jgi:peptidoglycan hydrolase-like protein with peptidoglycan-binding domain